LIKLKLIPKTIPTLETPTVFRLEGLMKKKVFEKNWSRKAKGDAGFDNGRNLVNGLFNRKSMHPALSDIDLVVLGVYGSTLPAGLKLAKKWGFTTVQNNIIDENPDHAVWLAARKEKGEHELDGIVIAPADWVMHYEDAEKPKNLVAYKNNNVDDAAECKVKRVIYQTSGFGRIVPTVEIEPTQMDGVVVTYCTVHNAKWMLDRGIGPGAILKIVRSGGVIPKVVGVVKKGKIQLPEVPHKLVGVNFMASENSAEQDQRVIERFLTTLGIEFIARKTIASLYESLQTPADYIVSVYQHGKDLHEAFVAQGFGPVQSKKMAEELRRVLCNEISLKQLMVASSCFDVGVGERRLSAIEAAGISMNALAIEQTVTCEDLGNIPGFADKTVDLIQNGVEEFYEWFKSVKKYLTVNGDLPKPKKAKKVLNSKLAGVVATFTGYRDQAQLSMIESLGGVVADFSSKTTILLYREGGRKSSKIEKAGDKAMTFTEFCKKYGV
jgi:DNA ligase (NAD+)